MERENKEISIKMSAINKMLNGAGLENALKNDVLVLDKPVTSGGSGGISQDKMAGSEPVEQRSGAAISDLVGLDAVIQELTVVQTALTAAVGRIDAILSRIKRDKNDKK